MNNYLYNTQGKVSMEGKHTHHLIPLGLFVAAITLPSITWSGMTWGDKASELGAITLTGNVRAKFQHKDFGYDASDEKIQFDLAQIRLNYDAQKWFGQFEYRCYQYSSLCDFSTLVDGYVGYKLSDTNKITLGVQPVPFGPARYWESSLYGGINNTVGLEDAHNLGANLHWTWADTQSKFDIGFFLTDGGNYIGTSADAARYTGNAVDHEQQGYDRLSEEHMWIGRVVQPILNAKEHKVGMDVGASYWYSDIANKTRSTTGNRKAWSVFSNVNYQSLGFNFTYGQTDFDNADLNQDKVSVFGSYDSEYLVANKANFYSVDLNYTLNSLIDGISFYPYLMHSRYDKDEASFATTQRNILGLSIDYKNMSLVTEYIMSKNDPFIGGDFNSLAQGDDNEWKKMLNLTYFYRF